MFCSRNQAYVASKVLETGQGAVAYVLWHTPTMKGSVQIIDSLQVH
jgi:hypothetical protein